MPTAGTMHRRAAPITLSAHSSTSSVSRSSLRRSLVPETARRDAPLSHYGGFRLYIMCVCHDSRRSGLYFQLCELHFSSDVLSIRFARPHIRCREPRWLPHLVCRLLTHKLLINSRPLPLFSSFQLYSFVLFYAFFLSLFSLSFLPLYR